MAEPLCISMKTWKRLSPEQQKAFTEVAEEMERDWVVPNFSKTTDKLIEEFTKAGVKVHLMTEDEFKTWLEFAKKTAWKNFAETVPKGQEILDLALEAMK
jgi:TRAP-type C4-dicarboxylate transport system substrate-binding protein